MNTLLVHGSGWLGTVVGQSGFWLALCLLAALAGASAFLAEWQRRVTLIALVHNAPDGTVVVQERGRGGPAMQVYVGAPSETNQGETGVTQRQRQVTALWEREGAGLSRYARVRTGCDQDEAEDLVQQTFVAAFEQWASLVPLDSEQRRNWLRSVCRNKWIDGLRREILGGSLQPGMERLYGRVAPDPADVVIARDDLDCCLQVIRGLPPRRRQVALLYFFEQQSVPYIAELLDLQPGGVRKHVAKAKEALRVALPGLLDPEPVDTNSAETGTSREGEGERA
ncbi:sigma-70 family RNA polymerase sigma factor [Streptomyces sp. NPDC086554]|uniref:RNA polymerase sigma factor n=1 Tax=Streptomyces sp. NPDC086554 TaxID=3154864 RepID=UPI00341B29F0